MRLPVITALVILLKIEFASAKQTSYLSSASSTVPAFPVGGGNRNTSAFCELDLSAEMFGGVEEACGHGVMLERSRCCPVLAAWLFAAHARSALRFQPSASTPPVGKDPSPMMPETDSKHCADALQTSLAARNISLPRPNATCDAALCFCGIHLHEISSLSCSADFNLSASSESGRGVKPSGDVLELERNCGNASYAGCTRCLNTVEKLNGGRGSGGGERMARMMDRDCRLMGVTWLLWRNKTAYIPTVSAVLRAILYSVHPPSPPYKCSLDQDNMPLAVDSIQVQHAAAGVASSSVSRSTPCVLLYFALAFIAAGQVAV